MRFLFGNKYYFNNIIGEIMNNLNLKKPAEIDLNVARNINLGA